MRLGRIMGKDGPETRSIARFRAVLGIVGGGSGGSREGSFSGDRAVRGFRWWDRAKAGAP